jgi:predicted RNase H-like HicB family nuclease
MEAMKAYTVIVHQAEEGETGYWAEVAELPGCFGSGETLDELDQDIRDAIELYIQCQIDLGRPVPEGKEIEEGAFRRWDVLVPEVELTV